MNTLKTNVISCYGPALLSGFLLFLSFPQIGAFPLAWIALAPLLVSLYDKEKMTAFRAGLAFGLVYFFGTTYWIYHSINTYGSVPLIPSLLIVLLLCGYLSLYPALFALFYSLIIRRSSFPAVFVAPVLWTTLEFIRSYALTGFPWSSLGYSQYPLLPMIQIADITGIYGVSFLLVAFNGAIADVFVLRRRRAERPLSSPLPTLGGFLALAVVLTVTLTYGFYRLYQKREGSAIRVAVIQGNIEQDKKWDPAYQREVTGVYERLSTVSGAQNPHLIVWPETAVPFFFGRDSALTDSLITFQRTLNSYLLFGSVLPKYASEETTVKGSSSSVIGYSNSAVLLDRDGNVTYTYDKIHIVPFGEYVPLRRLLFFVDKLVYGIGDYIPGSSYIKAVTPFGSFGTLICYEIIFPGLVRKFYAHGGDFMVTITNDAWFGKTSGPYQHFSMAVFRAIENRKPVIRAANSGISGFIDSSGRIIGRTELFERTTLVREIESDGTVTIFAKYGDIFSYLCIICSLLLFLRKGR